MTLPRSASSQPLAAWFDAHVREHVEADDVLVLRLAQRLAGGARQLDDAEADEHLGGLRAHDARLIDRAAPAIGASARSRSPIAPSALTADARTTGSGSAAAPISALTIAGVTSARSAYERSTAFAIVRGRERS